MEKIADIIEKKGGFITVAELSSESEYRRVLRAVERGDVVKVCHGVYAEPSAVLNTMIDVDKIVPGGIVCLYSAWSCYGLTTTIPPAFCIAIDSKRKIKTPDVIPVQLYYWKKEYLSFGITEKEISGCHVRMTDIEHSVCDAVKYRNKIGLDVCAEIVRNYLKLENRNISKLMGYAVTLRVAKVLGNYLEMAIV